MGLVIILFELGRKKYFIIDHITFFNFFFFLVYSFTPLALLIYGSDLINYDMPYGSEYFGNNSFTSSIVLGAYLLFVSGYQISLNSKQNYYFKFKTLFTTSFIVKILPLVFGVLFVFLYFYIAEFGGLREAIDQSEAYRSSTLIFHKFGFLERFFPLNTILLYYLFFKIVVEGKEEFKNVLTMYFAVSIIFALIIISMNSSRGYIIFQALGLYVIYAMYHKNYYLRYMIPAILIAVLVIKFGKPMFSSMSDLVTYGFDTFWSSFTQRLEANNQNERSIVSFFTHPIVSLEASLVNSGVEIDLRYFKDILYAFFSLLPNELLGIKDPIMLMQVNTLLLEGRLAEDILPGILGFFSYQLNTVGVLAGSFFYGVIGGYLYKIFTNFYEESKGSLVFIYMISISYGYFVFRGSPVNLLIGQFILIVVVFVIFFYSRFIFRDFKV